MTKKEYRKMLDYCIVDPSSIEFNRGSFCYLPYILYSALRKKGYRVRIEEDFTVANVDNLPEAKNYLISLWSYPQIDACLLLNKLLKKAAFFGYYSLIQKYQLPEFYVTPDQILTGLKEYPNNYNNFRYILLSDCDMHLKKYSGIVYPLFTSYGCSRKCAFCPSAHNTNHNRLVLKTNDVLSMLEKCHQQNITNIHFTDEDFFYDIERTYEILRTQKNKNMRFIALGSASRVSKFIQTYGEDILVEAGVKLIEVGLETADETLSNKMFKGNTNICKDLAKKLKKTKILWLTMSFFPGETVGTLNNTGAFLKEYGFKYGELYGRIATNGTEGGLGQFFQLYDGVKKYTEYKKMGIHLTSRPIRLLPSYIPYSFLQSKFKKKRQISENDVKWFQLYKINPYNYKIPNEGIIEEYTKKADDFLFYAICARLRIIVGA